MLVGVIGGTCSGKETVCQFLLQRYSFSRIIINSNQHHQHQHVDDSQDYPRMSFDTETEALNYATSHWRSNFVISPFIYPLEDFQRRPFFLLVSVEAPLGVRFQRWEQSYRSRQKLSPSPASRASPVSSTTTTSTDPTSSSFTIGAHDPDPHVNSLLLLEEFVRGEDHLMYGDYVSSKQSSHSLHVLTTLADIRIINSAPLAPPPSSVSSPYFLSLSSSSSSSSSPKKESILHFWNQLHTLRLLDPSRLRPSWDAYFMRLCDLAARRSNCMKRRVGCILAKNHRVVATGYNGTPRGIKNCNEGGCKRCNDNSGRAVGLDTCLCLHAEDVCVELYIYIYIYISLSFVSYLQFLSH